MAAPLFEGSPLFGILGRSEKKWEAGKLRFGISDGMELKYGLMGDMNRILVVRVILLISFMSYC